MARGKNMVQGGRGAGRFGASGDKPTSTRRTLLRMLSYLGQLFYSFDNRYYLTGNYRRDGSSIFGSHHQWGQFWAVGASWNIHNEPFFDVPAITTLKLRGTYGNVGNSRIEGYFSDGSVEITSGNGYRNTLGGVIGEPPTPDLSWETVHKTNAALNIGLWNRLDIGIEFYYHKTVNLLTELGVSQLTGARNLYRNAGVMRNRGVELDITSRNIVGNDFSWSTTFTLSHNKNKVLELYEEASTSFTQYGWYEGHEKNVWTLIRYAGVDPRDGSPLFLDANGNITRSYNYGNRVPLTDMSRYPTVFGGLTNTFRWKNLELYIQFIYSIGGWTSADAISMTMDDGRNLNSLTLASNVPVEMLDRWREPGDITNVPRLQSDHQMQSMLNNTRRLVNMTYISLNNVALSYTLPSRFTDKLKLKSANVQFVMDRLFLWSPHASKTRNSYKTVREAYPAQRTFSLKLNVNF